MCVIYFMEEKDRGKEIIEEERKEDSKMKY